MFTFIRQAAWSQYLNFIWSRAFIPAFFFNHQPFWTALVDCPEFLSFLRCSVADGSLNTSAGSPSGLQNELMRVFSKASHTSTFVFLYGYSIIIRCFRRTATLISARIPSPLPTAVTWGRPLLLAFAWSWATRWSSASRCAYAHDDSFLFQAGFVFREAADGSVSNVALSDMWKVAVGRVVYRE
jgi:hypothetical protein